MLLRLASNKGLLSHQKNTYFFKKDEFFIDLYAVPGYYVIIKLIEIFPKTYKKCVQIAPSPPVHGKIWNSHSQDLVLREYLPNESLTNKMNSQKSLTYYSEVDFMHFSV